MEYASVKKKELPDAPGVYLFLGPKRKILYIGKATSLRDRVRSYFSRDLVETRGPLIVGMISVAQSVDYIVTDSVLEALILEANLIKKYKPHYNTMGRDDKSFNYVVITREKFPRVLLVRGKDLEEVWDEKNIKYLFGPFPHGGQLKEAMKIIRKLFPYFDTKKPVTEISNKYQLGRVRFNQQIGVYPSAFDEKDYARTIQHIRLFFEGKKARLIKALEREMQGYAKREEFEKAERLRRTLFGLTHIQDVALIKRERMTDVEPGRKRGYRIEAYDVAHQSGKDMTGVMVVVENGEVKKADYRKFKIRSVSGSNDTAALKEILERRLEHLEWQYPNLIVVDGGKAQRNIAEFVLKKAGLYIPVINVVKDEYHRPRALEGEKALVKKYENEVLLANSEAHRFAVSYHRSTSRRSRFS